MGYKVAYVNFIHLALTSFPLKYKASSKPKKDLDCLFFPFPLIICFLAINCLALFNYVESKWHVSGY